MLTNLILNTRVSISARDRLHTNLGIIQPVYILLKFRFSHDDLFSGHCITIPTSRNMKAARYYGPGDLRVEDIPEPVPTDGQVKVKVTPFSNLLTSIATQIVDCLVREQSSSNFKSNLTTLLCE